MLSEYYWEIVEDNHPKVIRIVATEKEESLKKIREVYQGEVKLLEIRPINY
jgi:hypothetical protein